MKIIWALLVKDWKSFWGDKVAVLMTFVVPVVVIFVIGNIFGISSKGGGGGGPSNIGLAVVDETGQQMVEKMIQAIEEDNSFNVIRGQTDENGQLTPLTEKDVRAGIINNEYRFALVFPEDALAGGFGFNVKLFQNPRSTIETQMTEGLLQKNLMTAYFENIWDLPFLKADPEIVAEWNDTMTEMISEFWDVPEEEVRAVFREDSFVPKFENWIESDSSDSDSEGGNESAGENLFGQLMGVEKENLVGNEIKNPQGVLIVSGYSIMFLMFSVTGMASSLFDEKKAGIFLRLLSSPVTRSHILWSKYVFGIFLGLLQVTTMYVFSWLVFGVDLFHSPGRLFVSILFAAALCTALGMLICSITKTQAQANGFGTLVIILMSAVGGAWIPVSWMDPIMQLFSKFTVVYWCVEALQRVAFEGKAFVDMLGIYGIMTLITAVFISFSLWRFKRGDLF